MSEELRFDALPDLKRLYVKAALRRRKAPTPSVKPPELTARADDVSVDAETLERYRRIARIVDDGLLPPTYPQVLATPLHASIIAHRDFPLPAMGLVHLENRIEQVRPIEDGERFDLHCSISGWEWDERLGVRCAISTELVAGGDVVWRSELWALSRGDKSELVKRQKKHREPPPPGEPAGAVISVVEEAPADLGRRYSAICKDYNPIHLHPLTAKPFGFRKPIIHGMWTLARCWAAMSDHAPTEDLELSVRFKQPLYLPSTFRIAAFASDDGLDYECRSLSGDRLYLEGRAGANR